MKQVIAATKTFAATVRLISSAVGVLRIIDGVNVFALVHAIALEPL